MFGGEETGAFVRNTLIRRWQGSIRVPLVVGSTALALSVPLCGLRADQVQMLNGDRYLGRVLSLNTNTLLLQSDVLGTVRLPREKVALITLGSGMTNNLQRTPSVPNGQIGPGPAAPTNEVTDISASLRQIGANTNFIEQVRTQFLGTAGPAANNKFNELVGGLMSGKLSVTDIRAEAKSAADQIRELKRDLGEDAGWALDGYLAILENFLHQTAPVGVSAPTNVARPVPKAKAESVPDEE